MAARRASPPTPAREGGAIPMHAAGGGRAPAAPGRIPRRVPGTPVEVAAEPGWEPRGPHPPVDNGTGASTGPDGARSGARGSARPAARGCPRPTSPSLVERRSGNGFSSPGPAGRLGPAGATKRPGPRPQGLLPPPRVSSPRSWTGYVGQRSGRAGPRVLRPGVDAVGNGRGVGVGVKGGGKGCPTWRAAAAALHGGNTGRAGHASNVTCHQGGSRSVTTLRVAETV